MKLNVHCHLNHLKTYFYNQVQLNQQFRKHIRIKETSCYLLMAIISNLKILTERKLLNIVDVPTGVAM